MLRKRPNGRPQNPPAHEQINYNQGMDIVYRIEHLEFEWNPAKAKWQPAPNGGYMSNIDPDFNISDESLTLNVRPRESETVSIDIPKDTFLSLEQIAERKDMSLAALLRFYIDKGLRQDRSQSFADHVIDSTAKALEKRNYPPNEVAEILQEIQMKA